MFTKDKMALSLLFWRIVSHYSGKQVVFRWLMHNISSDTGVAGINNSFHLYHVWGESQLGCWHYSVQHRNVCWNHNGSFQLS